MKKFKALASVVMILALVLSFGVAAFADGDPAGGNSGGETTDPPVTVLPGRAGSGTVTVSFTADATGIAATAYQVIQFNATAGAWELTDWAAAALGDGAGAALTALTNQANSNESAIRGYLTTLANAANKPAGTAFGAVEGTSNALAAAPGTVAGGYLVIATATNYTYSPMFASTFDATKDYAITDTNLTAKGVKKNIVETKAASDDEVQVDDVITYTVTGEIPNYQGTAHPKLVVTDTLSTNTVLANPVNLAVTVNGALVSADAAYTTDAAAGAGRFTVTFNEAYLTANANDILNKPFVITYDVRVTGYEEDNTYTNTISSTINVTGVDERPEDVTHDIYTAAIEFTKVGATNVDAGLAGAQFRLSYTEGDPAVTKYVTVSNGNVTGTEAMATDASIVTSAADGKFAVKGLDPDITYTITEVTAPNSYAKLQDVALKFTQDTTDKQKFTAAITGDGASGYSVDQNAKVIVTATITDPVLVALPATGGVGIVVVSVIGVAVMLAFGGAFIVLKKKKNEAN